MGGIFGGPAGQNSKQKLPNWARGVADWLYQGKFPGHTPTTGPFADAIAGWAAAPPEQIFGGLADQIPNAQRGGMNLRDLASNATGQGYMNVSQLANQTWGPVGQMQDLAGQIPGAYGQAQGYLDTVGGAQQGMGNLYAGTQRRGGDLHNLFSAQYDRTGPQGDAMQEALAQFYASGPGSQVRDAKGAGQQVVDAALAAPAQFQTDIYNRAVADARPAIAASYSARGLGQSGAAARGEQDSVQRLADDFAQQAVQARIGALNAAANASGAAASQAIGAQQAAIGRGQLGLATLGQQAQTGLDYGRLGLDTLGQQGQTDLGYGQLGASLLGAQGQLGLQASQMPGQILQQMQNVAGAPLDAMTQAAQLQMAPLQLAGLGGQVYSQGLNLPLEYQTALYNLTRDPAKAFMNSLAGTQQNTSKADFRGLFGIPK